MLVGCGRGVMGSGKGDGEGRYAVVCVCVCVCDTKSTIEQFQN